MARNYSLMRQSLNQLLRAKASEMLYRALIITFETESKQTFTRKKQEWVKQRVN